MRFLFLHLFLCFSFYASSQTISIDSSATLDSVTITAFNGNTGILNTAASVQVLNREQLSGEGNQSFVSAINIVPGIKMDERSPGSYRLSIRGNLLRSAFGVRNVKIYWNGLPFTDAGGNSYLNALSPTLFENAEVIKGPSGSMYGAGTGGVLLLSDQNKSSESHRIFSLSAGNLGAVSAALNITKSHSGFAIAHQQNDGYRAQSLMRRDNIKYNARIHRGQHDFRFLMFASNLFYKTPGGLTLAQQLSNPRQARPAGGGFPAAVAQKASIDLKMLYVNASDELKLNDRWSNKTGIYFTPVSQANPAIRNYEFKKETGYGARSVFQFHEKKFSFSGGIEFQSVNSNTATYGNRAGKKDTLQYHDHINVKQLNIFSQSVFNLPAGITATAGISYNDYAVSFIRENVSAARDRGNFKPLFIPRITLLKKIGNPFSVYVSYSSGYSPPSVDEIHASNGIFNTLLEAERGINYEGGLKGSVLNNRLRFSAACYLFALKQTIVSRRDASGADFYVNAGNTDQKGTELFAEYTSHQMRGFIDKIGGYISYTGTNAFFKNYKQGNVDLSGKKLTGTPNKVFSAGANINSVKGFYMSSSFTYTGRIPLNDANSFFDDPFTLMHARLGFKKTINKKHFDFYSTLQKSFDDLYSAGNDLNAAGNRFYNPASPFNLSVGITISF